MSVQRPSVFDRRRLRHSFGRAAAGYSDVAVLQREVESRLLEQLDALGERQPLRILDVGVGFGKWGHLFREYTDINEAEHDPARYARENWRVQIDGIEGFGALVFSADCV